MPQMNRRLAAVDDPAAAGANILTLNSPTRAGGHLRPLPRNDGAKVLRMPASVTQIGHRNGPSGTGGGPDYDDAC